MATDRPFWQQCTSSHCDDHPRSGGQPRSQFGRCSRPLRPGGDRGRIRGLAAAKRAASHGARVAVVEGDRVGGTCVIRGCVPKKLLVYGSAYQHLLADAPSYGWSVGPAQCAPSKLLAAVRAEVDRLNGLHIGFLERAGVELVTGWGRFLDAHHLEVVGRDGSSDGSRRILCGERLLIATGGARTAPRFLGPSWAG